MSAWKRLLAVGCSHGHLADRTATDAILRFRDAYKPHTVIHLGDAFDMTCFRGGAAGSNDEGVRPDPDVSTGLTFLERLRPNVFLCGNHEDRLWRLRESPKAIVASLADCIIREIEKELARHKAKLIPYTYKQEYRLADILFMHGFIFSENAIRDTAEAYAPQGGKVVFAHSHRAGMATGRRADSPLGFNTGTLISPSAAEYAKTRRSTLSWSQGFVWGAYNDNQSTLWLNQDTNGSWKLPI